MIFARIVLVPVVAVALVLAGCSAGGSSSGGSGGGNPGGTKSGGSASGGSTGGATASFTGDLTGTIAMNLCTDSGADSIFVTVKGDSQKYVGSVSSNGIGFIGPNAVAWARSLDKNPTVPVAISGGSGGYTVDGVHVYDLINNKEITVSGKLVCP